MPAAGPWGWWGETGGLKSGGQVVGLGAHPWLRSGAGSRDRLLPLRVESAQEPAWSFPASCFLSCW